MEYFDRKGLLALEAAFVRKGAHIEGIINLLRRGAIPEGYHPPADLYLNINHRVAKADFSPGCRVKYIEPDPVNDAWTKIAAASPVFPLKVLLWLSS
ncbi:MAG: hypothetical protein GX425_13435 [Peptococcaceae bacterium]|nr:hypothetical protein [Peptococcaceae bacterium]